jgi:hypothetical protein
MSNVIPPPQRLVAHDGTEYVIDYCIDPESRDVVIRHITRFLPHVTVGSHVKITDVPDYLRLLHWQSFNGY